MRDTRQARLEQDAVMLESSPVVPGFGKDKSLTHVGEYPYRKLLGVWRIGAFFIWTGVCLLIQAMLRWVHADTHGKFLSFYHAVCCKILGLEVKITGAMSQDRPTLFVSNHVSYLDIPVLGSLIHGKFIAKIEVSKWPMFGFLARIQDTVFVDRTKPRQAMAQTKEIVRRLKRGDRMILFPEGTSSDGSRVLKFKSSLFAVSQGVEQPISVQPVSISVTHLDGVPIGRGGRPYYAWYGDMELVTHLWRLCGLNRIRVEVTFHPTVSPKDFSSRKELAAHCQKQVASGIKARS